MQTPNKLMKIFFFEQYFLLFPQRFERTTLRSSSGNEGKGFFCIAKLK